MRKKIGRVLLVALALIALALLWWRLPGRIIGVNVLDYVRAYDDSASGSILIVAAFDAGSFGVIDSCSHAWQGGNLNIEMRSKMLLSRDGRSIRIAAFRVPYTGAPPTSLDFRGGVEAMTVPIEPMPAGFTPLTTVLDSAQR